MSILVLNNISKSFDEEILFSNVNLNINKNDKVAIVGKNGTGKTTLLKIIMNKIDIDTGEVIISNSATIASVDQFNIFNDNNTIFSEVLSEKKYIIDIFKKIKLLESEISIGKGDVDKLINEHANLLNKIDELNGYAYESEAKGVLKGVGFKEHEFENKINNLSGGEKTKIALAKLLLSKSEIIILDEPTNHLDIESIVWLENYINNLNKTVLFVSHDRYFIDRICNKVIGIRNKRCEIFKGNYSDYIKKSDARYQATLKQYERQQDYIKKQEEIIARFRQYGSEKYIKKAKSREKLLEHIDIIENPYENDNKINISINPEIESGNDVLNGYDINKSFDNKIIIDNSEIYVKKYDRVAIVGKNGCGKTTLLKMIIGAEPFVGHINIGANVNIGYYEQNHDRFNLNNTLFEEIHDNYPHMNQTEVRNALARFAFINDDVFKKINTLSGGERARLRLCILFLQKPNLLILDEPTNHLDVETREVVEDLLLSYKGTVIFVSHDRYFINKIATRIIAFENKKLVNYLGNYDYYKEKENIKVVETKKIKVENNEWKEQKRLEAERRKKINNYNKLKKKIEELEEKLSKVEVEIIDPKISSDYIKLSELNNIKNSIEEEILIIMEELENIEI